MSTTGSRAGTAAPVAPGVPAVSRRALVKTIASREIWVKLHDKGFIASTIFFLVIIVAATVIPIMINDQTHDYRLAAVGEQATVVANVAAGLHTSASSGDVPKVTLTMSSAPD